MILFLGVEDLLVSRDSINSGVLSVQMFIEKLIEIFSNETSKSRFDEIERRAYVGAIFSLLKQIPGTSVSSECKQRTIGGWLKVNVAVLLLGRTAWEENRLGSIV